MSSDRQYPCLDQSIQTGKIIRYLFSHGDEAIDAGLHAAQQQQIIVILLRNNKLVAK